MTFWMRATLAGALWIAPSIAGAQDRPSTAPSAAPSAGAYRQLFTRVVYTEWLFFALMAAGLFVLRRRPDYRPPYRTWGYPVVPVVFIAASLGIVAHQLLADPREALIGLGLVALGVPAYYLVHANRRLS